MRATNGDTRLTGIKLEPRYGLLTLALLAAITGLSALPELSTTAEQPLVQLVSNLSHVPLFAGLTFCLLKTLSGRQEASWGPCGLTFVTAAVFAALDEWHQSFVPGRLASVTDFLLDLAGIAGMLLILRWTALAGARHEERHISGRSPPGRKRRA